MNDNEYDTCEFCTIANIIIIVTLVGRSTANFKYSDLF